MRVYPVNVACPRQSNYHSKNFTSSAPTSNPLQEPVSFQGRLKFGDYVVGAICGGAMAAVGFAVAGPVGAFVLGTLGAKATAEANNESRPPEDSSKP